MSDTDLQLLARYTRHQAEDAFAEVVRRHLDLVYCAALRQVRSPQLAEEVAQSTFINLARHANRLAPDTILAAWLYQVARREAIDVVRREARRQLREQIASEMNAMNAARRNSGNMWAENGDGFTELPMVMPSIVPPPTRPRQEVLTITRSHASSSHPANETQRSNRVAFADDGTAIAC